jgi:hypothetical protein
MAILQIFPPDDFFSSVKPREFKSGQFCWFPVPEVTPVPQILDVERNTPEEHDEIKFYLRNANQKGDFQTLDRGLPVKRLNLRSNEELLVHRAKKRPGIILTSEVDIIPEITKILKQRGQKHLQEDSLFVIPCYHIETMDIPGGFPAEMVSRIRCLVYRQFFYFPSNTKLREGIARFDRIQVIVGRDPSAIEPIDICLSEDVFNLFLGLFIYCITGIEDDELSAVRSLTREAYSG